MEKEKIGELIQILESSTLTALEVEEDGKRIRLERGGMVQTIPVQPAMAMPQSSGKPTEHLPGNEEGVIDMNAVKTVKSSMVGVFYAAGSPGTEPYVSRGSKVKKGDVLCIIEAMKLMNEITSDVDGEIADICVENGQMVEYNQVLFKIF